MKTIRECKDCSWALRAGELCGHPNAIRTEYQYTGRFGSRVAVHRHVSTELFRANGGECGVSGALWRRESWLGDRA
jgi:hypothetical protein